MAVGRNDPCPCGSGKKFKKCCLDREEAAWRQAEIARGIPPEDPPEPASPWEAAWAEISALPAPLQVARIREFLTAGPGPFTTADAADLMLAVGDDLLVREAYGDLREIATLAAARCGPFPAQDYDWAHHFLALAAASTTPPDTGLAEALGALAASPASVTARGFDEVLDVLRFRGLHAHLADALARAVATAGRALAGDADEDPGEDPDAEEEGDEASGDDDTVAERAIELQRELFLVLRHLMILDHPEWNARDVLAALVAGEDGASPDPDVLAHHDGILRILRGRETPSFAPGDFVTTESEGDLGGRLAAVHALAVRRLTQAGWPATRADLALGGILGLLEPGIARRPRGNDREAGPAAWLVPAAGRVRGLLDDLLLGRSRDFRVAALVLALPAWVDTLAAIGLLSPDGARAAHAGLGPVLAGIPGRLRDAGSPPWLVREVQAGLAAN